MRADRGIAGCIRHDPQRGEHHEARCPQHRQRGLDEDRPHAPVLPGGDDVAVFVQHLHQPARPAAALGDQARQRRRHGHPHQGARFVAHVPEALLQFPGEFDVLGRHLRGKAADVDERRLAECRHHPGHRHDAPPDALRAAQQADDGAEFDELQAGEEGVDVLHPRVAGDGGDPRMLEMRQHVPEDVGHRLGVRIHDQHDFAVEAGQGIVHGHGLAFVLQLGDEPDLTAPDEVLDDAAGGVGRAVVDHDDLVVRVVDGRRRRQGVGDDALLVVCRNQDRDLGIASQCRGGRILFPADPEEHRGGDPDQAGDDRVGGEEDQGGPVGPAVLDRFKEQAQGHGRQ